MHHQRTITVLASPVPEFLFPTLFRHQLCIVVHSRANLQRTPSLSRYISITYSCIRSFEPGGRRFESVRACHFFEIKSSGYCLRGRRFFLQHYQCGTFAGPLPNNLVRSLDKTGQFRCRVVTRNPSRSVSKQVLSILKRHACCP